MRRAVQTFLTLRRTTYPINAISAYCSSPKNISDFTKELCRHPYCQTLILTDHETGMKNE